MVGKKKIVIWDLKAKNDLKEIYDYLKQQSLYAAKRVRDEILSVTRKLPEGPNIFVADELKEKNDGTYRVFYIFNYRIVYRVKSESIIVLRIQHTSREPKEY